MIMILLYVKICWRVTSFVSVRRLIEQFQPRKNTTEYLCNERDQTADEPQYGFVYCLHRVRLRRACMCYTDVCVCFFIVRIACTGIAIIACDIVYGRRSYENYIDIRCNAVLVKGIILDPPK